MLKHIVLMTLKGDVTDEQVDAAVEALSGLPAIIPEIRSYEVGRDAGLGSNNAGLALVATFDSVEDYQTYLNHPSHGAVARDLLVPIAESFKAIQFPSEG
jgi:hypothetical protein